MRFLGDYGCLNSSGMSCTLFLSAGNDGYFAIKH